MKDSALVSKALAALDANGLRTIVREMLPWLDDSARTRLVNALIDRAARGASGWAPPGPSARLVSDVKMFASAAIRTGQADAEEVNDYLRHGMYAFLSKDYPAAFAIFRALLLPVAHGEIDLGQHEMLDEVLSVDVTIDFFGRTPSTQSFSPIVSGPSSSTWEVIAARTTSCMPSLNELGETTSAGRRFDELRSVKGKRTRTMSPRL